VRLAEAPIAASEEIAPEVVLDIDERGEVVGFEFPQVLERRPPVALVGGQRPARPLANAVGQTTKHVSPPAGIPWRPGGLLPAIPYTGHS
jgi:hypothetical protein